MRNPADFPSMLVFLLVVFGVIAAITYGIARSGDNRTMGNRLALRFLLGFGCWLGLWAGVVQSGFLKAEPMPRLPIFFALFNFSAILFALSPIGQRLARLPLSYLVGFHAFRLPLEWVLHSWVEQGLVPSSMTWSGQNLDIVTGLLAVGVAPFASRRPALAWVFNVVGVALLFNVMRVAVLSSPLPFSWRVFPPLELAFHVPYFLIGPVCVAGALAGHIVLSRALRRS